MITTLSVVFCGVKEQVNVCVDPGVCWSLFVIGQGSLTNHAIVRTGNETRKIHILR
jgi:hypothetical protein